MRRLTTLVALAMTLAASSSEAAKPTSKPPTGGKPAITKTQTPKVAVTKTSTGKPSAPKGSTVKSTGASASKSVKPAKPTTHVAGAGGQQTTSAKSQKSAKPDTGIAKAEKTVKTQGARTASRTSPAGTSTPLVDFTATKVGQKLEKNGTLRSKIEAKLQAAGYTGTAYEAGYGFKNVGQLNAATNQVQNHGTSFDLLKVLMTGTYVDPVTHNVYRTQKLPDGTTQLVKPDLAINSPSTVSLGQAKQAISGGAEMPKIVVYTTTATSPVTSKTTTSSTATAGTLTSTTGKAKPRKSYATTPTTQPGGGNF